MTYQVTQENPGSLVAGILLLPLKIFVE